MDKYGTTMSADPTKKKYPMDTPGRIEAAYLMSKAGYVYVLMNVSMEGLVKIGRTSRDPSDRARELGAATGVPTPFILVFDAYFDDCARAEGYVHALLEQQGYRISASREFFRVPVTDAVRALVSAEKALGTTPVTETTGPAETSQTIEPGPGADRSEPWRVSLELAEAAYFGLGDTLEDHHEARQLYLQAAKLGSGRAWLQLGRIYLEESNFDSALAALKEGASKGVIECYAEMTGIFAARSQAQSAAKCWKAYFSESKFLLPDHADSRGRYAYQYLLQTRRDIVSSEFISVLSPIRDEIGMYAAGDARVEAWIEYLFYPERPRERLRGRVTTLNFEIEVVNPQAPAWLRLADRKYPQPYNICFFAAEDVLDEHRHFKPGQEVEFEVVEGILFDPEQLLRLAVNVRPV